ncbi:MAG: hypothetical protein ACE5H8_00595 [Alphaproteobacteria bacterium]
MSGKKESFGPGVYAADAEGNMTLVHPYQGGPYRLVDIFDIWGLGRIEGGARKGESVLVLERGEIRKLKTLADAFSFDFDQEFIEMCHAMHRFAVRLTGDSFRFIGTF